MPVITKDYSWKQNEDQVMVKVPLKGIPSSSVDISTYENYIKASFKPFIFEAFLAHPIQESLSRCIISNEEVEFRLAKQQKNIHWTSLCAELGKEEKKKFREEALSKMQIRNQQENAAKEELLQNLQRRAVQQQIDLETQEKKKIKEIQDNETNTAMIELEEWKTSKINVDSQPSIGSPNGASASNEIWEECSSSSEEEHSVAFQSHDNVFITKDDIQPVPFPRAYGSISVKFTPRAFPTPQRESQLEQEQAWLQKQAAAQRSIGFVVDDLRPEELNPQWLKEKGDSFFKIGNYLGAISAYSHGIKLSKDMSSLYVNRSAAHYALGNLQRVIEDCSKALELMTPKVYLNADARAKCHVRRGAALCKLGILKSGLSDLEEALLLKPHDSQLIIDIEDIKKRIDKYHDDI